MATLPLDLDILLDGFGESFDPSVLRTAMERGVPKERLINSRVLERLQFSIIFESEEAVAGFNSWYFDTIKRIGWFDMEDPRTGTVRSVRFVKGDIGTLTPMVSGFGLSRRDVTVEYLR